MRKEATDALYRAPCSSGAILARYGFSDMVIAAALVHDVIEDY